MPNRVTEDQNPNRGGPNQFKDRHYLLFNAFETMDTQADRVGLDPKRPAWLENLQPIAKNELVSVPAIGSTLATIVGKTIYKQFYANYGGNDYTICFTTDGAGYQVNLSGGAQVMFAGPGTFNDPDVTQWKSERILIADSSAGYATWDGTAFVKSGGVSPVIVVTNGGSGYSATPTITITGGTGVGATAVATVVGGVITAITITNPGTGYLATDVLGVSIVDGTGVGATATAKVWPFFSFVFTTVAVFQGRVWLAGGRTLQWTGTAGFDDTNPATAAGSAILSDADLVRSITALRNFNNYLYIFGDNSIKQIGTITVSGSATLFTITTLSSDQGTTFSQSIVSYNRLVVFANQVGVWAIFGSSVEKISNPMDGIFQAIDFSQKPIAAGNDLRNIRIFMLLVRYIDPVMQVTRSILLAFQDRKWYVISQGDNIKCMTQAPVGGALRTYVSSGPDVTPILTDKTTAVSFLLRSALTEDNKPMLGKRALRIGIAQSADAVTTITETTDSENGSNSQTYSLAKQVVWINNIGQTVQFQNSLLQNVNFVGAGFIWRDLQASASGIYLGFSLSGSVINYHVNAVVMEYEYGTLMRSINIG